MSMERVGPDWKEKVRLTTQSHRPGTMLLHETVKPSTHQERYVLAFLQE